eukprot:COSAG02_NODE_38254_length_431_cov_0.819277_1_plen_141_part_10
MQYEITAAVMRQFLQKSTARLLPNYAAAFKPAKKLPRNGSPPLSLLAPSVPKPPSWENACYVESDGCCAQFWCKERFAWNDTWVNPFGARGRSRNAPTFVLPALGDKEVADLLLEQPDLGAFVREMKAFIGFQLFEHNRGT